MDDETVEIAGDLRIAVPDSVELITSYVLREQERWFEDEWGFVPTLLEAGANVVDIGANYGAYTLPMARAIGGGGRLWAFEPTSTTAQHLAKSIELNGLTNVSLVEAALSDHTGTGTLALHKNSELNSLTSVGPLGGQKVTLKTLDQCRAELGWEEIAFVKMDAEGEEANILRGGRVFLSAESPLVMFELKHGQAVNLPLIDAFAQFECRPYRLVPGLQLLVPFEVGEDPDPYQLNLFCCKGDRAAKLAAAGFLVSCTDSTEEVPVPGVPIEKTKWISLPFAQRLEGVIGASRRARSEPDTQEHIRAIELFYGAHRPEAPPSHRYAALHRAFSTLQALCSGGEHMARLSTFARVAWSLGRRGVAVEAISKALMVIQRTQAVTLDEPFLPACPRFDDMDPAGRVAEWLVTSLLEQLEVLRAFSSYYTGPHSLANLEQLKALGFQHAEMERRRQLVRMRMGEQQAPEPSPVLATKSPSNLNPEYWNQGDRS
jgi:FkbM family methyltransferase